MSSFRLILSKSSLAVYLLIVFQLLLDERRGLYLPGVLSRTDLRIMSNTIFLSLCGATGMVFFASYYRKLSDTIQKSSLYYALLLSCLGQLLMELFPTETIPMVLGLLLSMAGWGYSIGYILYRVTIEVPEAYFGRFIGASLGLGAIVFFIIDNVEAAFPDMPVSSIFAFLCLATLATVKTKENALPAWQPPSSTWHSFFQKSRTYLVIATIFLSVMIGLCDSIIVARFAEYVPSFPASRLFYAGGLFLFGWLADKKFSFMPAIVLVISAYYLWFRTFHTESEIFILSAQLVEAIYDSPIIVLIMTGFLHIAAHSDQPEKWAVMSRLIYLLSMSMGLLAGILVVQYLSIPFIFAIYIIILSTGIALMYMVAMLYVKSLAKSTAEKQLEAAIEAYRQEAVEAAPNEDEAFITYCKRYSLTEREADVLHELLKGEKISAIAEALFISERTVRFHINNLLNKTGQDSQLSMVSNYYRNINNVT